jgi:hypothetical protein
MNEAEEVYRNMFLNAPVGMLRTDVQISLVLEGNDAVVRAAGDREEMLAASVIMADRYVNPGIPFILFLTWRIAHVPVFIRLTDKEAAS